MEDILRTYSCTLPAIARVTMDSFLVLVRGTRAQVYSHLSGTPCIWKAIPVLVSAYFMYETTGSQGNLYFFYEARVTTLSVTLIMMMNTEVGRYVEKGGCSKHQNFPGCTEENSEHLGRESRCSDPNSNRILPEYKPEASQGVLTCSLKFGTGDRGEHI